MASRRAVAGWALYDMANTVFSLAVVSLHFPLYLHDTFGLPDSAFAVANSASVAVMLVLSPLLGRITDQAGRRMPFLVASTALCVAATLPLGMLPWLPALALFGLANIGFLAGLVVYDALLPEVSTPQDRGRIGSLGVAVGYLGSFVGLGVGLLVLPHYGRPGVFVAAGLLFALLAIPCVAWVREAPRPARPIRLAGATAGAFRSLKDVLRGRDGTSVGRFLAARLFYSDAVNTMILFMGLYVTEQLGVGDAGATLVLATGIAGAIAGAPLWGRLADRIGSKAALRGVLLCWVVGLGATAALGVLDVPWWTFLPVAAWLGSCLGGTWSADRPLLLALAPPGRTGEYVGYYGMVGRFSAILGPLAWALVVDVLHWGRPAAVVTLLAAVLAGLALLRRVPDVRGGPAADGAA